MSQYLRKSMFAEEHTTMKLTCEFCSHVTHKHLPSWHANQRHTVVKCWFCQRTIWLVTIMRRLE